MKFIWLQSILNFFVVFFLLCCCWAIPIYRFFTAKKKDKKKKHEKMEDDVCLQWILMADEIVSVSFVDRNQCVAEKSLPSLLYFVYSICKMKTWVTVFVCVCVRVCVEKLISTLLFAPSIDDDNVSHCALFHAINEMRKLCYHTK